MKILISAFILFVIICGNCFAQYDKVDTTDDRGFNIDTSYEDFFHGNFCATLKIEYLHTTGVSTFDRYNYEILIIDSLLKLTFESLGTPDYNEIRYYRTLVLPDSVQRQLINLINSCKLKQKIKGIPLPTYSGYSADRLTIEKADLKLQGGLIYSALSDGNETEEESLKSLKEEMNESSTISGDFETFFLVLKKQFRDLDSLEKVVVKEYIDFKSEDEIYIQVEKDIIKYKKSIELEDVDSFQLEFDIDLLRINKFYDYYNDYIISKIDYSLDTRDSMALSKTIIKYDSLLNKYYKKLMNILPSAQKENLKQTQRKWLAYRDGNAEFMDAYEKMQGFTPNHKRNKKIEDLLLQIHEIKQRTTELFNWVKLFYHDRIDIDINDL